jgi:hypothetical protein
MSQFLPEIGNSSALKEEICGEGRKRAKGRGGEPHTSMTRLGSRPNLVRGLKQKLSETTGAKAKNILILLANSGICENAIKAVGKKRR